MDENAKDQQLLLHIRCGNQKWGIGMQVCRGKEVFGLFHQFHVLVE